MQHWDGGLDVDNVSIITGSKTGHLIVGGCYQTYVSGAYAIGDLIAGLRTHLTVGLAEGIATRSIYVRPLWKS